MSPNNSRLAQTVGGLPGGKWGLAVLLLAATVRLGLLLTVGHPELRVGSFQFSDLSDEYQYHKIALAVAQSGEYLRGPGGQPTATRPPGSTLPIAFLYWTLGANPIFAVVYVVVCSLLIVLVLGSIAKQANCSKGVQITAMVIGSLLPSLLIRSTGIWSDPPALLFVLLALLLVLIDIDQPGRVGVWIGIGLALAFAYLTRTANGILALFVLVWMGVEFLRGRGLKRLAVIGVAAAIPVLAWGLRNQSALGEFFVGSTFQGKALFRANNAVTSGAELPVIRQYRGFDLYDEARKGMYLGRAVPVGYVVEQVPDFGAGRGELEQNLWYQARVREFVVSQRRLIPQLLANKMIKLFTAEPLAPSILAERGTRRKIRWAVAAAERWFIVIFGAMGIVGLVRKDKLKGQAFLVFTLAGLATVFVSHPSARFLLTASACLVVPAAYGLISSTRSWIGTGSTNPATPRNQGESED